MSLSWAAVAQHARSASLRRAKHKRRAACDRILADSLERRCLLSSVLLSEIEANPPGMADNRYEYVELAGTPNLGLNGDYFVTIDGSAGTTGVADLVVNLSGYSLGSGGLLEIQSSATTGHAVPTGTTLVSDPAFFNQFGGFANGTLSFFLFTSPANAFVQGTDYDTNDDGVLDHLPAGAAVIDSVAIPDTNNKDDLVYGGVTVTENPSQNKGTADAVTRFPGNTSTTSAAWYGGELVDTNNVDSQLDYDPTREAVNEPANAYLTPGAFNFPRSTPSVTVTAGNAVFNGSGCTPLALVTGSTGTDSGAAVSYTFYTGSNISGSVLSGAPVAVGTYTVVANFAGDSEYFAASSAPVTFQITPATPAVTLTDGSGMYTGSPFTASAKVAGVVAGVDSTPSSSLQGVAPSVSYYNGSTATGTPLSGSPVLTGTYTAQATFPGSTDYASATSNPVTFTISPTTVLPAWLSAGSSGHATWDGKTLNVTGAVTIISNPGSTQPDIVAGDAMASVNIWPGSNSVEIDVGGIALSNGASMVMTTDRSVLVIGVESQTSAASFSIDGQSTLDLRDNDLVIHNGNFASVNASVRLGSGSSAGITSSFAVTAIPRLTSLGCINNSTGTASLYSSWDGVAVASSAVLIKYTYTGDANLDGKIDGSDYSLIDSGFLHKLTGWYNGDFNYDKVVDGSDYTLIDNTFNQQGGSLAATVAAPAARAGMASRLTATVSVFSATQLAPSIGQAENLQIAKKSLASEIFG